jgi:hypothetical protein
MDEKVGVSLIIGTVKGGKTTLQNHPKNTISSSVKAGLLKSVIIRKMSLSTEYEYELYVRIPPDVNLDSLGLDNIDSIAILPVQDDDVFNPQ